MSENLQVKIDSIYHHKTKEYFKEVLSSYENKNYRSAVVMLYSVVICDLIFKLMDLRDIHNDEKSKKILEDLGTEKEESPVSPAWESNLIEKTFKEANLLENDVYTHISTLKNYRNLSAHPVLSSIDILYEPNDELVKSLMKNILEGLLVKAPIFTKNIFVPFMEEIERIKDEFSTADKLKTYLQSKFFRHFNKELDEYIFKNLWKIVFKNNGERERKNRDINYKVLVILYTNYSGTLTGYIGKESDFFSQFLDDNESILGLFVDFLSRFPEVYTLLNDHAKQILNNRINKKFKLLIKAYFLTGSVEEHFKVLEKDIYSHGYYYNQPYIQTHHLTETEIRYLERLAKKHEVLNSFYDLMINYYGYSGSYAEADYAFDACIQPYYAHFNKNQFENVLSGANHNSQCYEQKYAKANHKKLMEEAKKWFGEDFDFGAKYPNLF